MERNLSYNSKRKKPDKSIAIIRPLQDTEILGNIGGHGLIQLLNPSRTGNEIFCAN